MKCGIKKKKTTILQHNNNNNMKTFTQREIVEIKKWEIKSDDRSLRAEMKNDSCFTKMKNMGKNCLSFLIRKRKRLIKIMIKREW